ncbi:hypothetical protein ACQBAT_15670 [Ornithinimicrobium sp. Y1847]|uniref:hypothetical protein n=1 Tax=unclassified Ornithinimicrobium TaxID=2615080 RepID=UPI003B684816
MSLSPGVRRRQQQLSRWAKRTPGYTFALEQVLPRVRRNAVLTDLAWRIFAPRHGAGHVNVALLPDRQVTGPDVARLPVVGVLATGLAEAQLEELMSHLAELQRSTVAFRPLLVVDRPIFAAARPFGYVVEHVLPRADWAFETAWEDYLAERLGSLVDHYQLWHLARTRESDGRLDPVDEALLRALARRLPPEVDVHAQG